MEDEGSTRLDEVTPPPPPPPGETQVNGDVPEIGTNVNGDGSNQGDCDKKGDGESEDLGATNDARGSNNDEMGGGPDEGETRPLTGDKDASVEPGEAPDDVRSLGDLDSLPAGDELALGAAGSDSGVEGCGRALSSGGGSRSCASSVVSCGSGCGSESSSLAGAPPRPRRRLTVNLAEPKRGSPAAPPRPAPAPRGPNLATRERARSREKPTPPEKPRPLTPKPRIRPAADLPNLVRESPALRAKPTKTSAARCRTPGSPADDGRWPTAPRPLAPPDAGAARLAADRAGTLPRRRRDPDPEGSPKHEATPPRRPLVARSASSRCAARTRVRIYAEKTSQTVLLGTDVEAALGGVLPDISTRSEVSMCSRGVQASGRAAEAARVAAAQAATAQERARRQHAERALHEERDARRRAMDELETNRRRLLELAGAAAAPDADTCLRALGDQLRAAADLAARQRTEIDALKDHCDKLHSEVCAERERARVAEERLGEAEREAGEMQEFLAAETAALQQSLADAEAEARRLGGELERSGGECRQLVRLCEQRRQEALGAAARARGGAGATRALDALTRRLRVLTAAVHRAYRLPHEPEPTVYHNEAFSRSDSGEALTPDEESRPGLAGAVARALRAAATAADDDLSRVSDDCDNSADLLDSETEPCFVNDPEYAEEWWSGAEGAGAWSGDELSPDREDYPDVDKEVESGSASDRESLRTLSAAIATRHRSEARDGRHALARRVAALDGALAALLRALRRAAASDADAPALAVLLRDKIEVTEKNVADVVVKKLAELDASKHMIEQYKQSVETLKKQLAQTEDEDSLEVLEEELSSCSESIRRMRFTAVEAGLAALGPAAASWGRLARLAARLDRLAFALAQPPPPPPPPPPPVHTTTCVDSVTDSPLHVEGQQYCLVAPAK